MKSGIGKLGLELEGPGGLIDLVVDALQRTGIDNRNPVFAEDVDGQRALGGGGVDPHDLLLRQAELHRDRLQLGDGHQTRCVGGVDDVALVDLTQTNPARQWRDDLGIAEHRLRVVDRRLIGIHQRFLLGDDGALGIGLLLRARVGGGKLTGIDNQVDPTTGTLKLKAEFPNANFQLWPGQFVNVRLKVETLAHAVVVPTSAVQRGPAGTFSYVIGDGDIVTAKPVVVTQQNETDAVIASGLSASDRVVTTGFANLSDGAKVIVGRDEQTPTADLAPRKKRGSRDGQAKDGQAKDGQSERRGKKGERDQGEGDQKGQTGPAQGGEPSGSGAKSQP